MITKTLLILPILAALISGLVFLAFSPVTAQDTSPSSNMTGGTNMTNATMVGNMTGTGNMSNTSSPMMSNSS